VLAGVSLNDAVSEVKGWAVDCIVALKCFTKTSTREQISGATTKTVLKADKNMIYALQKSPL